MATLKNHPSFWLHDDAAEALDAYEDTYGVIPITSAGRLESEQQELIDRWDRGGRYNRPPFLYPPYRPARGSEHVKGGGLAIDTPAFNRFKEHSEEFGFKWWGSSDPVHFYFTGWNRPASTIAPNEKDEEMIVNIQGKAGVRAGGAYYIENGKATFLGGTISGVPTLTFEQGTNLAKRVSGI